MKIVYVCNEYPPRPHGGIGTFVQTIARGMYAEGHSVTVVGTGPEPGEWSDGGVRVVTLHQSQRPKIAWLLNRRRIKSWLQSECAARRVDIIETPEFQGPLPFEIAGCPVVVRLHLSATAIASNAGRKASWLTTFCERRTLAKHRSWIPVSNYALALTEQTFGLSPLRHQVVYNPVVAADATACDLPYLPSRYILFAGSISRRKGAIALAAAARAIMQRERDLHLVYAGTVVEDAGRPSDDLIRSTVGDELADRVHFLGRVERPVLLGCMSRASLFAFPSSLETFGLVVCEAMLAGCPIVAGDIPPIREIIESGHSGILVNPSDGTRLEQAIMQILNDPEMSRALAQRGQSEVQQRFTLSKTVQQSIRFYSQCIGQAA